MERDVGTPGAGSAFEFTGSWREYLPIALSNLALTIVTLGIYRFWAKARERRYLWSRTRFIDDTLEWTGTGREMFIGFLMVALVVFLPLFLLNSFFQALVLRGQKDAAALAFLLIYVVFLWIAGFARFRALRYRLSRSLWHGIRGGSDDPGYRYAVSAIWKPAAGALAAGFMIPWSMTSLWNERWGLMSYGPHPFRARATWEKLMGRWIILLASPFIVIILALIVGAAVVAGSGGFAEWAVRLEDKSAAATIAILLFGFVLGFYTLIGLIGLGYYAAYFREVIGKLTLGPLEFAFTARSRQWLWLFLGDIALLLVTLGIGICFLGYRHWSFFVRHLEACGEIDLETLTQSATHAPREAEGFANAFDIGAI